MNRINLKIRKSEMILSFRRNKDIMKCIQFELYFESFLNNLKITLN